MKNLIIKFVLEIWIIVASLLLFCIVVNIVVIVAITFPVVKRKLSALLEVMQGFQERILKHRI